MVGRIHADESSGGSGQYFGAGGQLVSRDVSTPTQPQVELTFQLKR